MTLTEIRAKVKSISGRYDLVNDDGSDNGMDFYIQAGTRYLDLTTQHIKSYATYRKDLAAGDYKIEFNEVRSIKHIWIYDEANGRNDLTELSLAKFKSKYAKALADNDSGTPKHYAVGIINLQPSQQSLYIDLNAYLSAVGAGTAPFTADYHDIMFGSNDSYLSVLFAPKADQKYTVTIEGQFYSKTLSNDNDVNFWSANYPEVLINATMYALEAFYRNTAGMNDWERAMLPMKQGIEFDQIETEIAHISEMK